MAILMKKLLSYLVEFLIIAGKLVIFSIVFQIIVSILPLMTRNPIVWYKDNISLDSKAFILYLAYVFVSIVLFYAVGRNALRFKAKKWTNAVFAAFVFLFGIGSGNVFGKNDFYSIISPYFDFYSWFNFDITIPFLTKGGMHNYMKTCDWIIIALSLYFGMSSEIVTEGQGLIRMKDAERKADEREGRNTANTEQKRFTDDEKERIYENIRSVRSGKR